MKEFACERQPVKPSIKQDIRLQEDYEEWINEDDSGIFRAGD